MNRAETVKMTVVGFVRHFVSRKQLLSLVALGSLVVTLSGCSQITASPSKLANLSFESGDASLLPTVRGTGNEALGIFSVSGSRKYVIVKSSCIDGKTIHVNVGPEGPALGVNCSATAGSQTASVSFDAVAGSILNLTVNARTGTKWNVLAYYSDFRAGV